MPTETQDRGKKFNLFSHEISLATGAIALKRASKGSDSASNHRGRTLRNGSSAGPRPNNWRMDDACPIGFELAEQSEVWSKVVRKNDGNYDIRERISFGSQSEPAT